MQRSGCNALFIGFETFSQESLDRNHKGFNDATRFREAVSLLHERGIAVAGGFILGADGDTEENILALPDMIDRSEIDLARIAIFTPYPGTAAFTAMERDGRLLHRQWHLYDEDHVVFRPERLSPERLQELFYRTVMRTYTWKRILKRMAANKVISTALFLGLSIGFRKNYQNMIRRHRLPYRPDLFLNRY